MAVPLPGTLEAIKLGDGAEVRRLWRHDMMEYEYQYISPDGQWAESMMGGWDNLFQYAEFIVNTRRYSQQLRFVDLCP